MTDCIFCKIGRREIQAMVVFETDELIAFRDINPEAPVHILIAPKKHYAALKDFKAEDEALLGRICMASHQIAIKERIADKGYRIIWNNGPDGQQTVPHVHLHLLGGRKMKWPPG